MLATSLQLETLAWFDPVREDDNQEEEMRRSTGIHNPSQVDFCGSMLYGRGEDRPFIVHEQKFSNNKVLTSRAGIQRSSNVDFQPVGG